MTEYAKNTSVSEAQSRVDIENVAKRFGATKFGGQWDDVGASIGFEIHGRLVRFSLQYPRRTDKKMSHTESGKQRTDRQIQTEVDKETRRLWRSLFLVVKANLEGVASGIYTFDQLFMAHIVLPSGKTVGEHLVPQLEQSYASGQMPALLPPPTIDTEGA